MPGSIGQPLKSIVFRVSSLRASLGFSEDYVPVLRLMLSESSWATMLGISPIVSFVKGSSGVMNPDEWDQQDPSEMSHKHREGRSGDEKSSRDHWCSYSTMSTVWHGIRTMRAGNVSCPQIYLQGAGRQWRPKQAVQ